MALEVIGAGFGRTGTLSMKTALEMLGFGPCYHMLEVLDHPEHVDLWNAPARGELSNWDALLGGYRSCVDWPACTFWAELASTYPAAPILLTVRDPGAWYESCDKTIFEVMRRFDPSGDEHGQGRMVHELVALGTFGGRLDDRDHCISVFENHRDEVIATAPPDRLLVYEIGSGWEPLCEGLGVPVPDEPFPRLNDSAMFRMILGIDD